MRPERRLKIALYHNLPSGGAKRHTLEQVKRLRARGHTIIEFAPSTADLVTSSFRPYVAEQKVFEARTYTHYRGRIPFVTPYIHLVQTYATLQATASVNRTIAAEIDRTDVDVVLAKDCHITMNPYVLRYLRTPCVYQCHHGTSWRQTWRTNPQNEQVVGPLEQIKQWYYLPASKVGHRLLLDRERDTIQHASLVLANSYYAQGMIKQEYGVNSKVVYPGIDTELFCPTGDDEEDYVLTVGALTTRKGHAFLVRAVSHIADYRRPKLFIAANSSEEAVEAQLRALAERLGVALHIERITDDRRLVEVYSRAMAFVYAPRYEALGMAPLEALACGTPVVAVGEGGVRETLRHNSGAILLERDAEEFAVRLKHLLADQRLREEMGAIGRQYVLDNWRWDTAVEELEHFILRFDTL